MLRHRSTLFAACVLAATFSQNLSAQTAGKPVAQPDAAYSVGDKLAPAVKAPEARDADFKLTAWEALVPKDWDPMKDFKDINLGSLRDGDPRATAALERLKRAFDNAPTVAALNDARIRIAGFVVPLDAEGDQLREFLLVPYFGACIHTPPPPANQIIHVRSAKPIKGVRAMDAVWASGTVTTAISDTAMGTSGYRMNAEVVTPYRR